jgi:hypothetical protein
VFSGTFRCDISLWCFNTIKIGSVTYTKAQAFQILSTTNPTGDALLHLVKNLLETQLNVQCNHSPDECIAATILSADLMIGNRVSPPFGALGQLPAGSENLLVAQMHAYNGGQQCATSCPEDGTCPDP